MARKHSRSGRKRTHRVRKHRGGGWGFTGVNSIPGTPGTVSNPLVYTGIGDCRAVKPGYDIPTSQYVNSMKGLPGMSGGKHKKSRKARGKRTRKQRGGRYGFFPESGPEVYPNGAAWWAASYAPIQRIACEGTTHNPLNPTHTGSSAPPGAASPNYWMKGGSQPTTGQRGGAQTMAPSTYGVGDVDSMYYYAPTAGYANTASTWKDSVGAPVQIQVPFAARSMNQACLTTGGPPPLTGALQKGGSKRSRKAKRGGAWVNTLTRGAKNILGKVPGLGGLIGTTEVEDIVVTEGANQKPLEEVVVVNEKQNMIPNVVVQENKPNMISIPVASNAASNTMAMNPTGGKRMKKKSRKMRKHRKH